MSSVENDAHVGDILDTTDVVAKSPNIWFPSSTLQSRTMFIRKRRYKRAPNGFYLRHTWYAEKIGAPPRSPESVYYQAIEAYRDEQGRPRQRIVCTLSGDTPIQLQIDRSRKYIAGWIEQIRQGDRYSRRYSRRIKYDSDEIEELRRRIAREEKQLEALMQVYAAIGDWTPPGYDAEAEARKAAELTAVEAALAAHVASA